jgi:hypothetical protein
MPVLDYEREEEAILRIADRLGGRIFLDIAEAGTFDELRELISERRPHVVHLSGHGELNDGAGRFCFEDERGRLDARDLYHELAAGQGVDRAVSAARRNLLEQGRTKIGGVDALDADFTHFYRELTRRLTGEGHAILTCRYVPWESGSVGHPQALSPAVLHEPLPDFTEADFFKYLRRLARIHITCTNELSDETGFGA